MKKAFKRLAILAVVLCVGYFVVQSGWMDTYLIPRVHEYVALITDKANEVFLPLQKNVPVTQESQLNEGQEEVSTEYPSRIIIPGKDYRPLPQSVDKKLIQTTILQLTNELRKEKSVGSLVQNSVLEQAATVRAVETETSFSHTRPDGTDFYTVFDEEGLDYSYAITGENLAMATHHLEDTQMAEFLFEGWVESPGHYENLIKPEYQEIGIGVHYDGEFLYLVQIFGTPY